jgi:hypothetical protein
MAHGEGHHRFLARAAFAGADDAASAHDDNSIAEANDFRQIGRDQQDGAPA